MSEHGATSESGPQAPAGDPAMSAGDEHTTIQRGSPGESNPPAANQGEAEPVPSAPEESPQASGGAGGEGSDAAESSAEGQAAAGESSRAAGDQGEAPRPIKDGADEGAREMASHTRPGVESGGVPSPGNSGGVPVPSVHAAAGSSEEAESVEGVRATSVTAPGKPDGEVDTRA